MFNELLSDISFRQSFQRSYFQQQGELARLIITIKSQEEYLIVSLCNFSLNISGKLSILCAALLIGFMAEKVFLMKRFFFFYTHCLLSFLSLSAR